MVQGQKCLNKQYTHWNECWKAVDQIILFVEDVLCIVGYLVTSMACTYQMPLALTHCKLLQSRTISTLPNFPWGQNCPNLLCKCYYANRQSIIMHSKEESHIAEWRKPEWTWYIWFHIYILSIKTENQLILYEIRIVVVCTRDK